jgi:hypothetical protein
MTNFMAGAERRTTAKKAESIAGLLLPYITLPGAEAIHLALQDAIFFEGCAGLRSVRTCFLRAPRDAADPNGKNVAISVEEEAFIG